jgi:hypothetical protein
MPNISCKPADASRIVPQTAEPTALSRREMLRMASVGAAAAVSLVTGSTSRGDHNGGLVAGSPSPKSENPYIEMEVLEKENSRQDAETLWRLVHKAYALDLFGTSRLHARRLLKLDPNHVKARDYLGQQRVEGQFGRTWATAWEATLLRAGMVRHEDWGWVARVDYDEAGRGRIRDSEGRLVSAMDEDHREGGWESRLKVESERFTVESTLPLDVLWYVADELERLTLIHADLFELPRVPQKRFRVALYRTSSDGKQAGADGDMLQRYGAYYFQETLHVMFRSLGGITAVRHEAAHALNRAATSHIPQWFDEGIGVFFQFASDSEDGQMRFGTIPKHAFGTRFLERVKRGERTPLADAVSEPHVTMDSEHYSKFRAVVDFFMNGNRKQYRKRFIGVVFREQGKLADLLGSPGIEADWQAFVDGLRTDEKWVYIRPSPRVERLKKRLASLTPAK